MLQSSLVLPTFDDTPVSPMTTPSSRRFDALDGMRGLAALFVMVYHITEQNGLNYARDSQAAVDLFFVLSGFVIMHSYGSAILSGMRFGDYLTSRLIRLGPLYLAGLVLGVAAMGAAIAHHHGDGIRLSHLWTATGLGLVGLPYLNAVSWPLGHHMTPGVIFPLNGPAWSLFFELFINICFFFYLARWRRLSGWLILGLMALFLFTRFWTHEGNAGWGTDNFWAGFPRVAAEFFLGALLCVWHQQLNWRGTPLKVAITFGLIALVFVFFLSSSDNKALIDAVVLSPLAILAGAQLHLGPKARQLCQQLGDLSYPVYIIHVPLHRLAIEMLGLETLPALQQLVIVSAIVVVCAMVLTKADEQVRRALKARAGVTRPVAQAAH
jgi:peptidoglycan/LPS O-acetylase OafA/YrhL